MFPAKGEKLQSVYSFPNEFNRYQTFNDLFAHELEMLVSAETQMIAFFPDLRKAQTLTSSRLPFLLRCRAVRINGRCWCRCSKGSVSLLPVPVSRGIQALLEECSELLKTFPPENLRDAVMIAHMQRAEHYKMAAYASVHEYAKQRP